MVVVPLKPGTAFYRGHSACFLFLFSPSSASFVAAVPTVRVEFSLRVLGMDLCLSPE